MGKVILSHKIIRFVRSIKLLDLFLVFMLVFGFPFLGPINSTKFAILISLIFIVLKPSLTKSVIAELKSKKMIFFLLLCFLFTFYTLFVTVSLGEYDFTLFFKQIAATIYIPFIFLFFIFLGEKDIPKLIINAFILQSFFILLAIISQSFYDATSLFRNEITTIQYNTYGRLRGNAVAGYQFFGISTMYGYVLLYFILKLDITKARNIFIFIFLSLIGIVSGRYTAVAIILGLFIKFIWHSTLRTKVKMLISGVLFLTIFSFLTVLVYENYLDEETQGSIDFYLVNPIEIALETGSAETGSTNHLIEMYQGVEIKSLLFGEGRYVEKLGSKYYGSVDAGYLRMVLYYGLIGVIFLGVIQYFLVFKLSKRLTSDTVLKVSFFIYFLLLNFKGDVFFFSNNTLPLIIGFLYFSKSRKINEYINNDIKILN